MIFSAPLTAPSGAHSNGVNMPHPSGPLRPGALPAGEGLTDRRSIGFTVKGGAGRAVFVSAIQLVQSELSVQPGAK
jgi:hypothetical protein